MSLRIRIALLLGTMLLAFLGSWLVLGLMERMEAKSLLDHERERQTQMLNHWIAMSSRTLTDFTGDYARLEETAKLASGATPEVRQKVAADLTAAGVDSLWIFQPNGTPRFQLDADGGERSSPPLSEAEFRDVAYETPQARFFVEKDAVLLEICIRRLVASDERERHWLLVARRWDDAHLRTLAGLIEGEASVIAPSEYGTPAAYADRVALLRPLNDSRGQSLKILRVEHREPAFASLMRADARQARVFVVFGLLVVGALGVALHLWVSRPLKLIEQSLARGDTTAIQPLAGRQDEFGRLARLVESSFAQQAALKKSEESLRRTAEERAQLARDLHDGIIQSLYAAGMGLGGVRDVLLPQQNELASQLDQTRGILNETIHDVRNFISGLEPEALKAQSFTQAVNALLATMQAIRPLRATVSIDDHLAQRLTLAQRVHALQIAREAVSNALRHGAAGHVTVTLHEQKGTAEFEIVDDGRGFDTKSPVPGRGLQNLAERARELGGELVLRSKPGAGTSVKLIFTSPVSSPVSS
jgi:signal transduction histidine kinase